MDPITKYTLICLALLLSSAILLGYRTLKAHKQRDLSETSAAWPSHILFLGSALIYAGLVYLQVLPMPDSNASTYKLSLGGAIAIVGLVYLVIGVYFLSKHEMAGLSILMYLSAALCSVGLLFTQTSFSLSRNSWGLFLHLFLSLCAYASLSVAAIMTIIAPWQSRRLRKNPAISNVFIPSLERLDKETFKLIGIGFILLSAALFSGFFFMENMISQHLPHKVILSILSWLVFAVLLLGRRHFGWRGITAMRFALLGFFLLLLAYFGSKWVLEIVLQRSWT